MGFFSNIINSVKQATRSRFEINKDSNSIQFLLDTKDENYFTLEFDNMQVENLHDLSVQNAYKIIGSNNSLGALYIESIRLQPLHQWNCSAGSAFDRFLKEQFQKDQLKYIDSFNSDFTKLTKYQVDFEHEIGIIWFSLNQYEVFIIDSKGKLFNDLLEINQVKNPNLFIEDSQSELPLNIKESLTATNIRENYFSKKD